MAYSHRSTPRDLEVDNESWAEMQLYEFMEIFGPKFTAGMNSPTQTNIVLINKTQEQLNMFDKENSKGSDANRTD